MKIKSGIKIGRPDSYDILTWVPQQQLASWVTSRRFGGSSRREAFFDTLAGAWEAFKLALRGCWWCFVVYAIAACWGCM